MSLEDDLEEDMQIIQPDGSRACLNWELPDSRVLDPAYCIWKHTYDDNLLGIGTTFNTYDESVPCKYCHGYDNDCKTYETGE